MDVKRWRFVLRTGEDAQRRRVSFSVAKVATVELAVEGL